MMIIIIIEYRIPAIYKRRAVVRSLAGIYNMLIICILYYYYYDDDGRYTIL